MKKDKEIYEIDKCCVKSWILDLRMERTRTVQRRLACILAFAISKQRIVNIIYITCINWYISILTLWLIFLLIYCSFIHKDSYKNSKNFGEVFLFCSSAGINTLHIDNTMLKCWTLFFSFSYILWFFSKLFSYSNL